MKKFLSKIAVLSLSMVSPLIAIEEPSVPNEPLGITLSSNKTKFFVYPVIIKINQNITNNLDTQTKKIKQDKLNKIKQEIEALDKIKDTFYSNKKTTINIQNDLSYNINIDSNSNDKNSRNPRTRIQGTLISPLQHILINNKEKEINKNGLSFESPFCDVFSAIMNSCEAHIYQKKTESECVLFYPRNSDKTFSITSINNKISSSPPSSKRQNK